MADDHVGEDERIDQEAIDLVAAIEQVLAAAGRPVDLNSLDQVTAGASRQTFRLAGVDEAGRPVDLILQMETGTPRRPDGMRVEAAAIEAAHRVGVPCPRVVAVNPDPTEATPGPLGRSYLISEAVAGESIARKILRDDAFVSARANLAGQLGRAIGLLHTRVSVADVPGLADDDQVTFYRTQADELGLVSPAFELAFAWLEANRPTVRSDHVVHGDFRMGNLLVDGQGLTAVLDWELVHRGDPLEDLAWICVKAWRFGGPGPVAGVGSRADLHAAYEQTTGTHLDADAVAWWQLLGTLKWGIMCGSQASKFYDGSDPTTEKLAIGTRIAEQEHDVLRLLGRRSVPVPRLDEPGPRLGTGGAEGSMRPTGRDLVTAVEAQLRSGSVDDPVERFRNLVAANALAIALRHDQAADAIEAGRADVLTQLDVESEADLAARIRAGAIGHDRAELIDLVGRLVDWRVAVNNPRWLTQP